MEAARVRFAVSVTTACMMVLGAAGLARGGAGSASWPAARSGGERPVSLPPGPRTTVELDPADAPTTATDREPACSPALGGGPHPDEDVWLFGLPPGGVPARFVAVTPEFATPDQGRLAPAVPAEGGTIADDRGADVAWLRLPAGWTLVGGTAVVAGAADRYTLVGVCAARGPSAQLA
ncbi:hypothetical protein [Micromonospora sp. RTGN7]|uniref:hypothetical protein n=1 Tax=Micromonospora sp. RTGN7 TaxID=3016526 RepID=UPI0029FF0FDC|nr:hypothetical protein [Micromonospora sp. RTGN7]